MRLQDIEIGKLYRLKASISFGYVEPLAIIPANATHDEDFQCNSQERLPFITVFC